MCNRNFLFFLYHFYYLVTLRPVLELLGTTDLEEAQTEIAVFQ